jgi:predicted acyl esterase
VHAHFNVRGSGNSTGYFQFTGPVEIEDSVRVVEWLAEQPWSDGNVGMFGVSYFAKTAKAVAAAEPPALKAIFAPWAGDDTYRNVWYHGGILSARFLTHWRYSGYKIRYRSLVREHIGDEQFEQALIDLRNDPELMAVPEFVQALDSPDTGPNALMLDIVLSKLDNRWWRERDDSKTSTVPAYLGACWGNYAMHLPGAFHAYERWAGPKKLLIGPGVYLDRPLYQLQGEAVRWFDHWLKGNDTGMLEEPPIRCFLPPDGEWRELASWPPPEAKWMPFLLHRDGLLSEREHWPHEGFSSFNDSPYEHGQLEFTTPPLVEPTEILGPIVLTLFLSTTDVEALLYAALLLVDESGAELELTRGWLRASQREESEASTPWEPVFTHRRREPLEPDEIYELRIPIVATGRRVLAGQRLRLRVRASDIEPAVNALEALGRNHLSRPRAARITIHHKAEHPSRLDLPVTKGNIIGTFFSGGDIRTVTLRKGEIT